MYFLYLTGFTKILTGAVMMDCFWIKSVETCSTTPLSTCHVSSPISSVIAMHIYTLKIWKCIVRVLSFSLYPSFHYLYFGREGGGYAQYAYPWFRAWAMELSLPFFYDLNLSRLGFEHSTFRMRGERYNPRMIFFSLINYVLILCVGI